MIWRLKGGTFLGVSPPYPELELLVPTYRDCGGEIEFRHVDGQVTPIHVDGRRCSGSAGSNSNKSQKPFGSIQSYVNPNAHCPVCGQRVFFYQSPYGGRVFLSDLGWPWDKHGCTDSAEAQTKTVRRISEVRHRPFRSTSGEALTLYRLVTVDRIQGGVRCKFGQLSNNLVVFQTDILDEQLEEINLTVKELTKVPSFVVRVRTDHRLIEFLSGRTLRIDGLKVRLQTS